MSGRLNTISKQKLSVIFSQRKADQEKSPRKFFFSLSLPRQAFNLKPKSRINKPLSQHCPRFLLHLVLLIIAFTVVLMHRTSKVFNRSRIELNDKPFITSMFLSFNFRYNKKKSCLTFPASLCVSLIVIADGREYEEPEHVKELILTLFMILYLKIFYPYIFWSLDFYA